MKGQNKDFDFKRRISISNNDQMGLMKVHYDEHLASSAGMHFHCWIPKNLTPLEQMEFYTNFKIQTKLNRDAVSFSWDYLPEEL